jgi:hypothetical protein
MTLTLGNYRAKNVYSGMMLLEEKEGYIAFEALEVEVT